MDEVGQGLVVVDLRQGPGHLVEEDIGDPVPCLVVPYVGLHRGERALLVVRGDVSQDGDALGSRARTNA